MPQTFPITLVTIMPVAFFMEGTRNRVYFDDGLQDVTVSVLPRSRSSEKSKL